MMSGEQVGQHGGEGFGVSETYTFIIRRMLIAWAGNSDGGLEECMRGWASDDYSFLDLVEGGWGKLNALSLVMVGEVENGRMNISQVKGFVKEATENAYLLDKKEWLGIDEEDKKEAMAMAGETVSMIEGILYERGVF